MRLFHAALFALLLASPATASTSAIDPLPGGAQLATDPVPSDEAQIVQVYNEQDEKLGEANLVVVNDAGEPQGVVVMVNQIDEPQIQVVVPLDRIKNATRDSKLVIAATRDELKAMPRLQIENDAPDTRSNAGK